MVIERAGVLNHGNMVGFKKLECTGMISNDKQ
jgi:hypothetical protein